MPVQLGEENAQYGDAGRPDKEADAEAEGEGEEPQDDGDGVVHGHGVGVWPAGTSSADATHFYAAIDKHRMKGAYTMVLLGLIFVISMYALYVSYETRRILIAVVLNREGFADPTRAMRSGGNKDGKRVSQTERTKLLNPGGRKGSV